MLLKARRSGRHLEEEAAILIQKQYRAIIGGRVGRLELKRGRREIRDGWRQRRRDDLVRQKLVGGWVVGGGWWTNKLVFELAFTSLHHALDHPTIPPSHHSTCMMHSPVPTSPPLYLSGL